MQSHLLALKINVAWSVLYSLQAKNKMKMHQNIEQQYNDNFTDQ